MGLARTKTASIQNILLGDPVFCFAQFIAMRLSELERMMRAAQCTVSSLLLYVSSVSLKGDSNGSANTIPY